MELKSPSKAFGTAFWLGFALVALVGVTIAALFWIFDHPFGTNWDEARYINNAYKDVWSFRQEGLFGLAKSILGSDRSRPSAFRILVLPFTLPLGVSPQRLRIISFACLWLTVGLTFLAARCIAGSAAGAFAALFLITCPIIVAPNLRFYVDYPLYLAIAGLMYFLLADWQREQPSRWGWVGIGLALGLGAWSKPPIVLIATPILLLTWALSYYQITTGHTLKSLLKAVGLAIVVMSPWWVLNFSQSFAKAFRSGGYTPHSLGPKGSIETLWKWCGVFVQTMLGQTLALLTLAILLGVIVQSLRHRVNLTSNQWAAIALGFAGSLPMLILGAFGTNHNPRLLAPALLPLAVAIGILAALTGWTTSRWLSAAAVALLGFQLTVMVSPSASDGTYQKGDAASQNWLWGDPSVTMQRIEQWDWSQLKALCDQRQLKDPVISYLGSHLMLNVPQIARPWVQANEPVRIHWLWQEHKGEIDWAQVMRFVDASNVVLVAPTYIGTVLDRQSINNRHNPEFVQRLEANPRFDKPILFTVGRFERLPLLVFLQKPGQMPNPVPADMATNPFQ
ncbi:MAG: glycosyltransferase family 39 protein [Scytolyngbya sp. HA4215-MV1]|jgi:4-amino-4-deoxy-L-arabinose transferase-like glycosyltransferase|nr:glycosyltransferase family 39 protein [Scytolyngbya sp. HA4215-MV1]